VIQYNRVITILSTEWLNRVYNLFGSSRYRIKIWQKHDMNILRYDYICNVQFKMCLVTIVMKVIITEI
jgi:hypothetical protein